MPNVIRPVRHATAVRRLAGASAACPVVFASPLRRAPACLGLPFDESGLEIIGPMTSIRAETECIGECRDRRHAASFTSASRPSIRRHMNTTAHDFVTVDMRGLKAVLVARARMLA
jgi:hypothetical protein